MAKRIVAEDAKFSTVLVSGAGKVKNPVPVAPDMKGGDAFSASVPKKGHRGRDIDDEMLDDKVTLIAAAEQAAPDSVVAASEQPMILAQADAPLTPGSDPVKTEQKAVSSSGNAGWWWLGGVGLAAAGTGIGLSLSNNDSVNRTNSTTLSGTVTDGPVQGASLYYDVNANGKFDVGTDTPVLDANGNQVVTDALGNFSFTVTGNGAGIKLVTHGGTDTVTGEAVTLDFSAPAGYSQINPITSAVAAYMESNPGVTAAQAETAIESALGLPDLDYSTVNLADPPAGLAAADILAAQQAAAILATTAIIIEQSGADTDAFQYISANMGSGGSTDSLVTAVQNEPSVDPGAAAQLADTVAAVEAATTLDAIGDALNNIFYNETPVFTSASTADVAENNSVVLTVTATDADIPAQTVTFSITGGADQAKFTINNSTGALSFVSPPDFESPTDADGNNSYIVQVTANDGNGGTSAQTITATVSGVNDNSPVFTSVATANVAENSTAVLALAAADADLPGQTVTFSITGGADSANFSIDATTGALSFVGAPNYEAPSDAGANNVYDVQVTVTDTAGLTDVQDLVVTVTNVNEAPVITSNAGGATAAVNAAENQTAVTIVTSTDVDAGDGKTFSITGGADQALFAIDATTGALTFQSAPNYEVPSDAGADNVYDVQVTVTDTAGLADVQNQAVTVTGVNDNTPVITSGGTGSVAENSAGDTIIYDASATDADAGTTITYSLKPEGPDFSLISIDPSTGVVRLTPTPNYEAKPNYSFIVIASDGTYSSEQAVIVSVTDLNEAPVITAPNGGAAVALSLAENTSAVADVNAGDVDGGQVVSYSLSGADAALFAIDSATGVVAFASAPNFEAPADAGADNIYNITVTATDNGVGSLVDTQNFAITVTDENESVVVDSTGAWLDVNANGILDIEDTTAADFTAATGNIDLAANPITIHFNDVPDTPLDLTGFTSDDKIEIDVPAFNEARMRTSPAHSFTSLNTNTNAVYLGLDNSDYYSVFLSPRSGLFSTAPDNQGAFALYTSTIHYLAYWNDISNPLGNMSNIILPSNALSALNQGAGHGELIDFIWTPPTSFPASTVVVESNGAWLDTNADGVHDVNETTPWVGGIDNLAGHQVTVHFNDVPNQALDLHGFGSDDLIEIDAQAFINNGHNALNILTRPNIMGIDEFSMPGTFSTSATTNWLSNSGYAIINRYMNSNGWTITARVGLFNSSSSSLYFSSNNGSRSTSYQLATGMSTNLPLQQMVDFVNLPEPPTTVHVVVERDGALIDYDGDGVRDNGENRLAVFGAGGNADLAGLTPVIIHFNDIPQSALDLTGFGTDDKIEFDVASLQGSSASILNPTAAAAGLASFTFGALSLVGYNFTRISGTSPSTSTTSYNRVRVHQATNTRIGFSGSSHAGVYGISFTSINTSISGRTNGIVAYWTDTGNALNNDANLLPDYTGSNHTDVLAALNANNYPGLVEFVWPVNVVVDDQAGNVAMFIDTNANGVRDAGEDTLALIGQTQADVDDFNTAAVTGYGSQLVDLASEQVTIHYNDLPTGAWVPDLTGFDGNDRIEIDRDAMVSGISGNDTASLSLQNRVTMSSQTQFNGSLSGVSSGSTAVFLSGSNLKFGHRTISATFPTSGGTVLHNNYLATGTLEGVIASNAGAIANNFQQVVFVTSAI